MDFVLTSEKGGFSGRVSTDGLKAVFGNDLDLELLQHKGCNRVIVNDAEAGKFTIEKQLS